MDKLLGIHGTSSRITFEFEDYIIYGQGEFIAKTGSIDGFLVDRDQLPPLN